MVVLPPELRAAIQGPEGSISSRTDGGVGLRPRPAEGIPQFDTDEIVIDLQGTGIKIGIGEDGELHAPFIKETSRDENANFGENLALDLDDDVLNGIAEEVVPGVEADDQSRATWFEQYRKGIDLLGIKIEDIPSGGGQRRNISRAGHPLLMEAMVKYQAGAEAELLPASGPVKVPTIGRVSAEEEAIAKAFQDDFNYFLTEIATEYYPDTARMLMHQAFCGIGYKKIYRCPIRQRPTSESVLAPDLIVSEEATDLDNALRVTHRIEMTLPILRRMQIVGQYRDVDLGMPAMIAGLGSSARRGIKESEGVAVSGGGRPQDQPYEIWETDVYLDAGYHAIDGSFEMGAPDGLPLPYKVTIDRNSRKILGMWRNWRPADQLYLKRNMYVKYGLVPGLGYHDWGFLQLLGNQTRTLRAILRLLIDAGMFSNFPGGIKAKNARAGTNEIAPGPGEFVDVDIPSNSDISKMVMPMPYKGPDSTFVQLMEIIKNDAMRLGGTVQLEVGEGRANMPVGTVMAMIEQQVQVMAGVHKRNHRAQKDEFRKLRELFAENPEDFALLVRDRPRDPEAPYKKWMIADEFNDLNVTPASDPNVPSSVHKLMMGNVLLMLAQQAPPYFDMPEVLSNAVTAIGADPARFIVRPDQSAVPSPPDPKIEVAKIRAQTEQQKGMVEVAIEAEKMKLDREKLAAETARAAAGNETVRQVAQQRRGGDVEKAQIKHESDMAQASADRERDMIKTSLEHRSAIEQIRHDAALHPPVVKPVD